MRAVTHDCYKRLHKFVRLVHGGYKAEPSSPVGGSIGSKEVPVSFEDLVQTVQAMGRLQKSMHEQLELLVAENARWRNRLDAMAPP